MDSLKFAESLGSFRHSEFVIPSSFVIRHSTFKIKALQQPSAAPSGVNRMSSDDANESQSANDAAESESQSEQPSRPQVDAGQVPPANIATLVTMFSTQTMVALGLIPNPATNKAEPQLPLAQHFIDLLGVLEEKTKGNLTDAEHRLLESSLHELRMAFLHAKQAANQ